jgi:hypothetical protein
MVKNTCVQMGFFDVISYPVPPMDFKQYATDIEIYARFMGALRLGVPSCDETRILRAVQYAADMTGHDDAVTAQTLVGLGLRGPRACFPAEYLNMADRIAVRALGFKKPLGAEVAYTL